MNHQISFRTLAVTLLLTAIISINATNTSFGATYLAFDRTLESDTGTKVFSSSDSAKFVSDGVSGQALSLTGKYESLPKSKNSNFLDLGISGKPFSISLWIRPTEQKGYRIIMSKSTVAPNKRNWWLAYNAGNRRADFLVRCAGNKSQAQVTSKGNIRPGVWNHLVAVYDGKEISIYVAPIVFAGNYRLVAPVAVNSALNKVDTPTVIGGRFGEKDEFCFCGDIDELAVFDKALSAEEVNELFLSGKNGNSVLQVGEETKKSLKTSSKKKITLVANGRSTSAMTPANTNLSPVPSGIKLQSTESIVFGPFSFSASLNFSDINKADMDVIIGADGFRFRNGKLVNFGNAGVADYRKHKLDCKLSQYITSGKAFRLDLSQHDGAMHVSIGDKEVFSTNYSHDTVGTISICNRNEGVSILSAAASGIIEKLPEKVKIFSAGEDNTAIYRIPAFIQAADGTLLAFAEARRNGVHDLGNIDMVLKRSIDNGKTWLPMQVIHDEGGEAEISVTNPSPVLDPQTGRLTLVFHICKAWGNGTYRLMKCASDDNGKTWTKAVELPKDKFPTEWLNVQPGPGKGIVLRRGPHAERMIVPVWIVFADEKAKGGKNFGSACIYSDDKGSTWNAGGTAMTSSDECQVVELSDGSVMMSIRPSTTVLKGKTQFTRRQAISFDGGVTWQKPTLETPFTSVVCQGSVTSYEKSGHFYTVLANPLAGNYSNGGNRRAGLSLRYSTDDGKTWFGRQLIEPGRSAYSDIWPLQNGKISILFEGDGFNTYGSLFFSAVEPLAMD